MVIGVVFSGILAGLVGVVWALTAGFPLLVALMFYPAGGIVAALALLPFILRRQGDQDDYTVLGTAQ